MTAVMRPADARLSASIMISSSIRLSLPGVHVGCIDEEVARRGRSR